MIFPHREIKCLVHNMTMEYYIASRYLCVCFSGHLWKYIILRT